MENKAPLKLQVRLPRLTPDEEKALTDALQEVYSRGYADAKEQLCKECSYKEYYARVASQNDCNDCGISRNCPHVPRAGKIVRINCPLWRPK